MKWNIMSSLLNYLLTYLLTQALSLRRNSNGLTLSSGIVLHLEPQYLLGDMSLHLFDVLGVMHHQFTSTIYNQDSKLLASLIQWHVCFLAGWSGAEIKCTVHVALTKRSINQFKLDQQSRQQELRAYCQNIYKLQLRATLCCSLLWKSL